MTENKTLHLSYTEKKRLRANYGTHDELLEIPHLYEIQIKSYENFIKADIEKDERSTGLDNMLKSIFPMYSNKKNITLEYKGYSLGEPTYTPTECKMKGLSYTAPLKIKLHLAFKDINEISQQMSKPTTQDIYLVDLPLMTQKGTFIINGTEKVIVAQLHKSAGLSFEISKTRSNISTNKIIYVAKVIPQRGAWLDIEIDSKNCIHARIDKKKKFPVTLIFKAFNIDAASILKIFHRIQRINLDPSEYKNIQNKKKFKKLMGCVIAQDIPDQNGKILINANTKITNELFKKVIIKNNITYFFITSVRNYKAYITNTLRLDKTTTALEAITEIYNILRPGEPIIKDSAKQMFDNLFFTNEKYDLSIIGRMKINTRLNKTNDKDTFLKKEDIIEIIKKLIDIKEEKEHTDDIDHLGNRRVRSVGEVIENHIRVGFLRMEKSIKEKLALAEHETLVPKSIVNTKTIASSIREFFNSSQLSQFMDQTNPLAETTHKRRVSALGPGGLTRERAGFEVRDVHNTHYGRICPIETPEGPNIGLINSLALYAKTNKHGFLETPYIKVKNKRITTRIEYLSAVEESDYIIAQADAKINKDTKEIIDQNVSCRFKNEFIITTPEKVDYIDVSPKQIISVATSLIPFLEHDDANRALMGSNMQRQAVPILKAEKPLIGTGIERTIAKDSGATIIAKRNGTVIKVDNSHIMIRADILEIKNNDTGIDTYNLVKYIRSNQNTCINQKPLVKINDKIKKGDIIADGSATDLGELALGQNLFVAFMSWNGYNFEDSIILSEKIIKENKLMSIHIEELVCIARELKLGPEEITADIPNVTDIALKNLDESGIIYLGADVTAGDILVGKITKKQESQLSPEEKLLEAIFGEKASTVKDSSLRVPTGMNGKVIDVQILNREGITKDKRTTDIESLILKTIKKDLKDEFDISKNDIITQLDDLIDNYKKISNSTDITTTSIIKTDIKDYKNIIITDKDIKDKIYIKRLQLENLNKIYETKSNNVENKNKRGDDLPPGVLKIVKITIAMKKQIQVGDKLSGRHGNKGVISAIIPEEDMPYLKNGETIDIILNPLGVPSRMNIGQVFETHLGWAAKELGKILFNLLTKEKNIDEIKDMLNKIYNMKKNNINFNNFSDTEIKTLIYNLKDGIPIATPVFDGIKEEEIRRLLNIAKLPISGKTTLYDGKTGRPFDNPTTIGYQYIMKLNHLVDDKIHARSTGPYSLVSQQPLGGKAQFGGQRFGEMEVWALEAYGAAYTLQEMLTIKSDDINGRTQIYKNIIDNHHEIEIGIPEAFNVLTKEILSLGINIELEYD